jgi:hypothetical protein
MGFIPRIVLAKAINVVIQLLRPKGAGQLEMADVISLTEIIHQFV